MRKDRKNVNINRNLNCCMVATTIGQHTRCYSGLVVSVYETDSIVIEVAHFPNGQISIQKEYKISEDFHKGVRAVIIEADYTLKFFHEELDRKSIDEFRDWSDHYDAGLVSSIKHLKKCDRHEVFETLLDEIRCEDLLEDYYESFVLNHIMKMIFPE